MARLKIILTVAVAVIAAACGNNQGEKKKNSQRAPYDPEAAKIQVDVAMQSKPDGAVVGTVAAAVANTQVLKVTTEVPFKGTNLFFPPSSFEVDQEVEISAFSALGHKANVTTLIDDQTKILAIGPSIQISWTYDEDTYLPYTIEIPAPNLNLQGADDSTASLAIFYLKNDPTIEQYKLGYISSKNLTYKDGVASFQTSSYGVYQPVWLDKVVTEEKSVTSTGGIGSATAQTAPSAFELTALNAKIYGKKAIVRWGLADFATQYDLLISNKDAACSEPSVTYQGLLTLNKTVEFKNDGDTWVCVIAKNTKGQTAATNNGLKILVDASPPPAPTKPVSLGGNDLNTLNLTFSWGAVTDSGPAGIRSYFLQVGSTAGGNDHFSSTVGDETSKFISAFNGAVYYARVKVVDNAGNESEWSPVSDKVTVNTD